MRHRDSTHQKKRNSRRKNKTRDNYNRNQATQGEYNYNRPDQGEYNYNRGRAPQGKQVLKPNKHQGEYNYNKINVVRTQREHRHNYRGSTATTGNSNSGECAPAGEPRTQPRPGKGGLG